ncbi:MAG: hypothetical protein AB1652_08380 [Bacillota bacterium]
MIDLNKTYRVLYPDDYEDVDIPDYYLVPDDISDEIVDRVFDEFILIEAKITGRGLLEAQNAGRIRINSLHELVKLIK